MNLPRATRAFQAQTIRTVYSQSKATVPLWRAIEDGSEESIKEADLYKHQRHRWLYDTLITTFSLD